MQGQRAGLCWLVARSNTEMGEGEFGEGFLEERVFELSETQ